MTSLNVPASARPPLQTMRWVRNGQTPDAQLHQLLRDSANQAAGWRTKEVARFHSSLSSSPATGGTRNRWRNAWHTSPFGRICWVKFVVGSALTNTGDPFVRFEVKNGVGTTIGQADFHFGASGTPPDQPAWFGVGQCPLALNNALVEIPTDTDLFGTFTDNNGSRLLAACVFETALEFDTDKGYLGGGYAAQTPILDFDRQSLVQMARTLWKRHASQLWNWTVEDDASARTRTANTSVNIIDNTSTVPSANTPGVTLDLVNHSTVRRGTVPCAFKVFAGFNTGTPGLSTGVVELVDSTNTVLISLNCVMGGSAGWYSTTVNLPATVAKYDIRFKSNGVDTFALYATSLYQYE